MYYRTASVSPLIVMIALVAVLSASLVTGQGAVTASNGGSPQARQSGATTTWQNEATNTPLPGVGCYTVANPSLTWTKTTCSPPNSVQFANVGGSGGFDDIGSTSSYIAEVNGNVASISGLTSEYDSSLGPTKGADTYSIQLNSVSWPCTYNSHSTTCWEQFVFQNYGAQNSASISIQYALLSNYGGLYGCPSGWGNVNGACYYAPQSLSTSVESISTLASQPVQLKGTANYYINSGDDVVTMCDSKQCWSVANFDNQVFSGSGNMLYQNWNQFEWNVFGVCCTDGAIFNTNPSPSFSINVGSVTAANGNALTVACTYAPSPTGEYNNLNIVSGSCNQGSGFMSFQEN